ncbi:class I SAM-dependent RNA methyltransferase [Sphingomonas sinipercae]|uniref:Class I SAM-dependent RNA methyltransferase n=1 Tax=Sphingomonas sinipercae TaxID=2714944 RepID=A0A6G7ZNH8_9SPHN|nr:class I SAM-dependent RNA methyltransferase [Sphingomonas sinipercae]QIL02478.1 class I SAM-dependent RNA methyltransferase [Sphingomonas sinipercae]
MAEEIIRIAARGDGVTQSGRHVAFAAPGDRIHDDGTLEHGPHHQAPPCRHFPECGGCQLQHVNDAAYRNYLASRIQTALAQHDLVTDIREPHLSPPNSRRRATLRALKVGQGVLLGFNAAKSHRIVDMRENHILRRELLALLEPLRRLLAELLQPKRTAEVQLTLIDQGVDVLFKNVAADGLQSIEALSAFAEDQGIARLSLDNGLGPETMFEPNPATIEMSGVRVPFPHGGFLQATADGEAALVAAVRDIVADTNSAADLFAGLGTFALALPGHVYAAEAGRDAALALKRAAPRIAVDHRDLYRRPLDPSELNRFAAVILDPPRSGAAEQVAALVSSSVERIAYVSCNPATFARDARTLVDGGYRLEWIKPVGQFRWSTHVELAAAFSRAGGSPRGSSG